MRASGNTALQIMDLQAVSRVVRGAEGTQMENQEFLGYKIGQLFEQFPEEITSGRAGTSRKRTPDAKVAKAYCKFVQAFQELETALAGCPSVPVELSTGPTSSKQRRGTPAAKCATLACLPVQASAPPSATDVPWSAAPPDAAVKQRSPLNNLKATSWVVARSRRFIARSVGISVTLLLPSITARAAGILIQVLTAVIAAGLKKSLNQAAEESNRIGSQLVKIAEDSLDICLSDEAPSPRTPSAAVASQVFSALANGSSAADIFEKLSVPKPPAPSPTATWKLPGWMLLVAGIAARHYMP